MKEEKTHKSFFGRLQRTPKWKKEEFSEIEYEPRPVKELLTEMKDISELIIDLAYSAVLFHDDDILEEVKFLEVRMDTLNYDIRVMAMMAARSKEDAEQLAGILQIAQAAEKISNAAGDIVLLYKEKSASVFSRIMKQADERLYRMKVSSKSAACTQLIGSLNIESETGMRIIAIRRNNCWIYNPQSTNKLNADDMLIIRGNDDGFKALQAFLSGEQQVLE